MKVARESLPQTPGSYCDPPSAPPPPPPGPGPAHSGAPRTGTPRDQREARRCRSHGARGPEPRGADTEEKPASGQRPPPRTGPPHPPRRGRTQRPRARWPRGSGAGDSVSLPSSRTQAHLPGAPASWLRSDSPRRAGGGRRAQAPLLLGPPGSPQPAARALLPGPPLPTHSPGPPPPGATPPPARSAPSAPRLGAPAPAPTRGSSEVPAGSRGGKEDWERGVPVPVPPASRSPRLAPAAAAAPAPGPSPTRGGLPAGLCAGSGTPSRHRRQRPSRGAGGKGTFALTSAAPRPAPPEAEGVRFRRPRGRSGPGGCVPSGSPGPRRGAGLREATGGGGRSGRRAGGADAAPRSWAREDGVTSVRPREEAEPGPAALAPRGNGERLDEARSPTRE